ncbi:hypothetical protein ACJX0J_021307 [Zea mays]
MTQSDLEQYYEMIISLYDWGVFVYYVSFFCNIMFFAIFRNEDDSHIVVMCRFLENSEVGNIGRVIIMFIHYQHNILVGITGGDMLNLGSVGITGGDIDIVNRIFCFCAPRNYALCLSCVPGASC